jgi:hypothetical protein
LQAKTIFVTILPVVCYYHCYILTEKKMKAADRHQLKTNVLADWLGNSPQWAKENLKTIIYVSVVIAIAAGAYFWKVYMTNVEKVQRQIKFTNIITQLPDSKRRILQTQTRGVDTSYMLLQAADNLRDIAQNSKEDTAVALALIKQAETLRSELHYRTGTIGPQDITSQIDRAKTIYNRAIETVQSNPTLQATATLGLGLCEEEVQDFKKARQIYRNIIENPDFEGTTAAAVAKQRLDIMADFQRTVVFKKTPKPIPATPAEIPIELPIDINMVPTTGSNLAEDQNDASANSPTIQ